MNLTYRGPDDISRAEFLAEIEGNDSESLRNAMVSAAFRLEGWEWLQDRYLELLEHDDPWVRRVAATCLAHVARNHGHLDTDRVRPMIEKLLEDPRTRGHAEDALEDIDMLAQSGSLRGHADG